MAMPCLNFSHLINSNLKRYKLLILAFLLAKYYFLKEAISQYIVLKWKTHNYLVVVRSLKLVVEKSAKAV